MTTSLLEVDNFLHLPCNVYMKDVKGIYQACNDVQAKNFGASHVNEVIGKSDLQLYPVKEDCVKCAANDSEVMQTGMAKIYIEAITFVNKPQTEMLSIKIPFRNNQNKIIGVFGISMTLENIHSSLNLPSAFGAKPQEEVKVTKRERECLECLAQGMTAKQIGRKLSLSSRTIEFYIENMKRKLGCANRIQLIAKANMFQLLK